MRIARFVAQDQPAYGVVENDDSKAVEDLTLTVLQGDPFYQGVQPTNQTHTVGDVRLVAPIIPRSKIVGIGRNWADHAQELGNEVPARPLMFLKPNTSVVGHGDPVTLPSWSEEISYEAELAVVIGTICKDVPRERVKDVIFGYTVANDLTARDAQRNDNQWARAKGFDGSCPLGPWIETELDTDDVRITSHVDGELRQDGTTADMIFDVAELVATVSEAFTLLPGDVILTGTPAGVGIVDAGARIEVAVEGIGSLATVLRR
ncbi:fumarylacetoacetate hydrolase family protein [Citricoccus muralis]|uniref:Fumarylacetoacetate hydrolase family protein n=1 Tax=Citricoccus muralis TaxID=169134 RepID=A0ABY8H9N3_9MICC|nr:fumarylacetoacetate hydrolase family protein [Citricoccus muralis]WFP17731.1 fumarylacetoacetate hydrolase family protein [Citricoccus muralis]